MKLIFIHIPKTAGRSMLHALTKAGQRPPYYQRTLDDISNQPKTRKALLDPECPIVMGLFGYTPELRETATTLCTVLRHPVDRIYSLYRYVLVKPGNRLARLAKQGLATFVQSDEPELHNHQCHILSGIPVEPGLTGAVPVEVVLPRALANIETFDAVATMENLEQFWYWFARQAGQKNPVALPHINTRPPHPEAEKVTPWIRRMILTRNAGDLVLYRNAQEGRYAPR